MTNIEGRVILIQRAAQPPSGVRTDLEVLSELADRLGSASTFPSSPAVVFEELRRASAGGIADYSGITWDRIVREDGIFWPCPDVTHPGTPRLFADHFPTPGGRARFHPVQFSGPAEEPDGDFPLYLTTGRIMAQYQSGTQTRKVPALMQAAPHAFVQIHPSMALTYGIQEGDQVRLTTRRGSASVSARLTPAIRMDTLFVPFHFAGSGRANLLTNPALDPVSRMPEFKVCAVRIEKGS